MCLLSEKVLLMSEDRHLLKRVRRGDVTALRRLYEKYRSDLFAVAMSLVHDVQTAEDCLQDAFVRMAEKAGQIAIQRNVKGYLISCVANRARDQLRRKPLLTEQSENIGPAVDIHDPAEQSSNREQVARLMQALSTLPYKQREVFVLRVQGGLKFRQIAKSQQVSIKTALSRYRYGIDKLRELLEKGNGHEIRKTD